MEQEVSILIGGPAGSGVFLTSLITAKVLKNHGYRVFTTNEYPSLIRGGHQWGLVRASRSEIYSHRKGVDILLALDEATINLHIRELNEYGVVVCDENIKNSLKTDSRVLSAPFLQLVENAGAPRISLNMAELGYALGILEADLQTLIEVIKEHFKGAYASVNARVAQLSYKLASHASSRLPVKIKRLPVRPGVLLDGNRAVALGALAGNMTFFSAYPMTPASPILHFLAEIQEEVGVVVVQPECEIAAINMAIGAAYAGARALVATSGGGFSLMVEALGQAGMAEVPVVIVNVQRPGPSTGLPTHTAQGDLRFTIHASQGEFPRVVLSPGDPLEAFTLTCEALNIAWRYQVPVILLSDKFLGESYWTVDELPKVQPVEGSVIRENFQGGYARYRVTEDGVSPMAIPGTKGVIVCVNANEHDEYGFVTTDPDTVKVMQEKRLRKIALLYREAEQKGVKVYGEGEVALTVWGSVKSVALEALKNLEGVKVVQVVWLEPFPKEAFKIAVKGSKLLVAENNATGQLVSLIREHLLVEPDAVLLKYNGRQFYPEEIEDFVRSEVG
ncbi:MAG: 2-oxoacid:acceptor oxidoreductase subunit alpha [Thermofilaceae archaeon]